MSAPLLSKTGVSASPRPQTYKLVPPTQSSSARGEAEPGVWKSQPLTHVSLRASLHTILVLAGAFFCHESSRQKARCLLVATLSLMLLHTGIMLWATHFTRQLQSALNDRDADQFYKSLYSCGAAMAAGGVFWVVRPLVFGIFAIEWRRALTAEMLSSYFGAESKAYYWLQLASNEVDNPDERIGQDIFSFTHGAVHFTFTATHAVMIVAGSAWSLHRISPPLASISLVYATCSVLAVSVPLARRLVMAQRDVRAREASFRFALVRSREYSDPIAFFNGEAFERERCAQFFGDVVDAVYRNLFLQTAFKSLNHLFHIFSLLIPIFILGPRYFSGGMGFAELHQAQALFMMLMTGVAHITLDVDMVAGLGASASRVQQLRAAMSEAQSASAVDGQSIDFAELPARELPCLQVSSLELHLPRRFQGEALPHVPVPLLRGFSLELSAGESLLVTGESGLGKSTLLRALANLWAAGAGRVGCCRERALFLPQVPYLCLGSLRENVLYPRLAPGSPGEENEPTDAEISAALELAHARHLVDRYGLDGVEDFGRALSQGERQRLCFARLLLPRGGLRLAVLDEATSALDESREEELYALLRERVPCYVSVGSRPSLEKFHSRRLALIQRDGASIAEVSPCDPRREHR